MSEFKEFFEREIVKVMRDDKIPSMSVLISKEGEPIYKRAFGIREKGIFEDKYSSLSSKGWL